MTAKDEILLKLRELKAEIHSRHKVRSVGLFGSFARGESSESSDVDILVEFEEGADLFDFVALAQFLEDYLGRKVDLVTVRALREEIRDEVLNEAAMV